MAGVQITENFTDFINASDNGNRSISFSTLNALNITMLVTNIGPVNCSSPDGYGNVSLRVKMVDPQIPPSNASIYLFSGGSPNFNFSLDLKDDFSNITASVWNNLTIPLATGSWVNNNANADWGNITGLRLEFYWPQNSNITMLVDGLFFRGLFKTPLDAAGASYLFSYSLSGVLQFAIEWFFISGIIFIGAKGLGSKITWKPILIPVGFILIVLFVQTLANTIVISTLPSLYYPFELFGGTVSERAVALDKLSSQVGLASAVSGYIQLASLIWIIALCAIAVRLQTEFSWVKSAVVSAAAVAVTFVVGLLLGI
jgi:hypothetical protein